jgi:hypothetical protein
MNGSTLLHCPQGADGRAIRQIAGRPRDLDDDLRNDIDNTKEEK